MRQALSILIPLLAPTLLYLYLKSRSGTPALVAAALGVGGVAGRVVAGREAVGVRVYDHRPAASFSTDWIMAMI